MLSAAHSFQAGKKEGLVFWRVSIMQKAGNVLERMKLLIHFWNQKFLIHQKRTIEFAFCNALIMQLAQKV